jgi:aminotransferase in exopolysaccharide biosynthesis
MYKTLVQFIQDRYSTHERVPLHAPVFQGHEREYVLETINSTFVSSVGSFVDKFEHDMASYTNSPSAVVTVNGTSALHIALLLAGVTPDDYVLTQALTFVATGNAIRYCKAEPIFIDVDKSHLGLSPLAMDAWLEEHALLDGAGQCRYKKDNRIIRACVPMHTFGHPVDMDALKYVCQRWQLTIVEDAAESLGSLYKGSHTGTLGAFGIFSFNGNKIITTGGGGMILCNSESGKRAKHLTTTAKVPHPYEFYHDEVGFNYRMPNLNAALGCAQLEQLDCFIESKRKLAHSYERLLVNSSLTFIKEPPDCRSNYWLNGVICADRSQRDELLQVTNDAGIMTRPVWQLLNRLPMFKDAPHGPLPNTEWLADRVVNLPSSVISGEIHA